jgi:uncharacterized protein (UPF0276 family)
MKLACNYYAETEKLARDGIIDIDYFKFPAVVPQMKIMEKAAEFEKFMSGVTRIRPVLLHGLYPAPHDLASPEFISDFDYETVNRLIKLTGTPGISLHPSLNKIDPAIDEKRLVKIIIDNINFLRQEYAGMDFISIENVDSRRFGALIKPEVIAEIVNGAQCSLILDISHAYCAARHTGEDFRKYLSRLPLKQVYEVHINGWFEKDNDIMCHIKINETGWQVLKDLLDYCSPEIITIEYGRSDDRLGSGCPVMSLDKANPDAEQEIIEQITRIREII